MKLRGVSVLVVSAFVVLVAACGSDPAGTGIVACEALPNRCAMPLAASCANASTRRTCAPDAAGCLVYTDVACDSHAGEVCSEKSGQAACEMQCAEPSCEASTCEGNTLVECIHASGSCPVQRKMTCAATDVCNPNAGRCEHRLCPDGYTASAGLCAVAEPSEALGTMRFDHTATVLSDGSVFVAGGQTFTGTKIVLSNTTHRFSSATRTWKTTAALDDGRVHHTATLLADGRVLIAGGTDETLYGAKATAYLYDPALDAWQRAADMPKARAYHAAIRLKDGRVLITGGLLGEGASANSTATALLYDPVANTWSPAGSMASRRVHHAVTLWNGQPLFVGGAERGYGCDLLTDASSTTDVFDADAAPPTFRQGPSMSAKRCDPSATTLTDGSVLVVGGQANGERLMPSATAWTDVPGSYALHGIALTALPDGRAMGVGGDHEIGLGTSASSMTFLLDEKAHRLATGPTLKSGRHLHTASLLDDGSVLVVGGVSDLKGTSLRIRMTPQL